MLISTGIEDHRAADSESLAAALADWLRQPPRHPLAADWVALPSPLLGRWLRQRLSLPPPRGLGVAARLRCVSIVELADAVFALAAGASPDDPDPFAPSRLVWPIMAVLRSSLALNRGGAREGLEPVARFLEQGLEPEVGEDGQRWRELKEYQLALRLAELFDRYSLHRPELLERWEREGDRSGRLEGDAAWQGLIWRELITGRDEGHRLARRRRLRETAADGRVPPGLPERVALFGLGELAAVHQDWLNDLAHLARVAVFEIDAVPPAKPEVTVHACPSRLREVELLYEALLRRFADQPEGRPLFPEDVLVLAPELENYGPLVEAVFGEGLGGGPALPCRIWGRGLRNESPLVEAFLSVLGLPDTRFEASRVLDLLDCEALRRRRRLDDDEARRLRNQVRAAGVRWGLDLADKRRAADFQDYPGAEQGSWRWGLDRLLLGLALGPDGLVETSGPDGPRDLAPLPAVEGLAAEPVGRLAELLNVLADFAAEARRPRALSAWVDLLSGLLEELFEPTEEAWAEMAAVREELEGLREAAAADGSLCERKGKWPAGRAELGLPVVREHLKARLERGGSQPGGGGGILVTTPAAARGLPARVCAFLGLDDGAFPGGGQEPSFDLVARDREAGRERIGDPDRRAEDRRLFAERLARTGEALHLSYLGRHPQDPRPRPPSVVICELTAIPHPMLPQRGTAAAPGKLAGAGELPELADRRVDLRDLCAFFRHPVKHLMSHRLGIHLPGREDVPDDAESFELDGLEDWQLGARIIELALAYGLEGREARIERQVRAEGLLPHGVRSLADEIPNWPAKNSVVAKFVERLRPELGIAGPVVQYLPPTDLGPCELEGEITGIWGTTVQRWSWSKTDRGRQRFGDRMEAALQAAALTVADGVGRNGRLQMRKDKTRLKPRIFGYAFEPAVARAFLAQALSLYRAGLRQPWPLPPGIAIDKGTITYRSDEYLRICFGEDGPPDDGLRAAVKTLQDLLEGRETDGK